MCFWWSFLLRNFFKNSLTLVIGTEISWLLTGAFFHREIEATFICRHTRGDVTLFGYCS